MPENKRQWMPVLIAAVAVVVFVAVFLVTRSRPEEGGPDVPGDSGASSVSPALAVQEPPVSEDKPSPAAGAVTTPAAEQAKPDDAVRSQPAGEGEEVDFEPSFEFFPEDRKFCGKGVSLDLGDYHVGVGEEFGVEISLEAESMESFMLVLKYDPELLAIVPDSAQAVGRVFRRGIEFNYKQDRGLAAIIHRGIPGQRNLLKANGETVVSFRMTALAEGETKLRVPPKGAGFGNAIGAEEKHVIVGGTVLIQ